MSKYILGSGLVAFIAKKMLPEYNIIPVGKSRYYQYNVATCDDYIQYDKNVVDSLDFMPTGAPLYFKRAISMSGSLIFDMQSPYLSEWLCKLYGNFIPAMPPSWKNDGFICGFSCVDMFRRLEKECMESCIGSIQKQEKPVGIDHENQAIHTTHGSYDYDHVISTIPRNYLFKLCNIDNDLEHFDLHTFVIKTPDLNFEGATEVLVADPEIHFYKCTQVGQDQYQFYSTRKIGSLQSYVSEFMKEFSIMSGTCVREAIPVGPPHDAKIPPNIDCIGSNAEWNNLIGMCDCIRKIIDVRNQQI